MNPIIFFLKYFWREKFKFCEHFQGDDFEVKNRERRDANGNRILRVVKRDATEMAEVETTEKIIQVRQKKLQVSKNPSNNICGSRWPGK